ncbi:helix-turn-helix transcriptional regulator [Caldimonas brevitalea]|uniref:Transcriptional regulator, DeoR family n=1 Tax=Caldimonas brevitalea TaxID=413882 RepID=A0A0G3BJH7_9BURK|nr:YafY family protein [Caldimonas brevitalea]AKJ26700.1 transcriptional regulator, DeoR family [Caldimonas brevitalea]
MSKPATRVLALLELLQTHRRMSGNELARRLGVDGRTLRRYVSMLEDLGVPVSAERGRYGGYGLAPGFKMPPLMFTPEETLALSLGLAAARRLGLDRVAPALESVQAKLERAMPAPLKTRLRGLSEGATVDIPPARLPADPALLDTLADTIASHRRVLIDYRTAQGEVSARRVDPYGLVFRQGQWYMSGWCHLRQELRSFRLDRVLQLQALTEAFEPPAPFDAAAHLTHSIATLPRAMPVRVLLHTDLGDACDGLGAHLGLLVPQPDGVMLHGHTDSLTWFARQLARLRCPFEVQDPPGLRDALREHAERLLRQLGPAHPPSASSKPPRPSPLATARRRTGSTVPR